MNKFILIFSTLKGFGIIVQVGKVELILLVINYSGLGIKVFFLGFRVLGCRG